MELDLASTAVISAVVLGLTQAFKGSLPPRLVPLMAITFGIFVSALASFALGVAEATTSGIATVILSGIIEGLTASGFYSSQKALRGK